MDFDGLGISQSEFGSPFSNEFLAAIWLKPCCFAENSSMSNPPGHLECPEKCNIDADADWMSNAFWICIYLYNHYLIFELLPNCVQADHLVASLQVDRSWTAPVPESNVVPCQSCHMSWPSRVKPVKRRTRGHEWESGESQGHQMHWMQWISITRGVATPSASKHFQNIFKTNITGSTSVICIYLPGYSMPSMPTTAPSKPPTAPIHESLEAGGASCFFDISGHIWAYLSRVGRSCWNERFCHRFLACCIILWPNGLFSERGAPHDDKRGKGWSQNLQNLWGMQTIHTVHGGCMLFETAFNVHPWNIWSKYFTPCQRCKTPMVPMVLVMQDTQQASKSLFLLMLVGHASNKENPGHAVFDAHLWNGVGVAARRVSILHPKQRALSSILHWAQGFWSGTWRSSGSKTSSRHRVWDCLMNRRLSLDPTSLPLCTRFVLRFCLFFFCRRHIMTYHDTSNSSMNLGTSLGTSPFSRTWQSSGSSPHLRRNLAPLLMSWVPMVTNISSHSPTFSTKAGPIPNSF